MACAVTRARISGRGPTRIMAAPSVATIPLSLYYYLKQPYSNEGSCPKHAGATNQKQSMQTLWLMSRPQILRIRTSVGRRTHEGVVHQERAVH